MPDPARAPITALRSSHDRLVRIAGGLAEETARTMSYCTEWTIAQVYSHLGSGAEIAIDALRAAVEHREPMSRDDYPKIWAAWNDRPPTEQVAQAVRADTALVEAYEGYSDEELSAARVLLFGMLDVDGPGLARFRLPELAIHTWDVAVALDPAARVLPDAVELIIDDLPGRMGWLGKPQGRSWSITVETTGPPRTFTLTSGEAVTLAPGGTADGGTADGGTAGGGAPDGVLRLPAEAFLRLTYGRLDDANLDGTDASDSRVTLAELRATFPGL
jgi:uncharacterized protein (TIGR03083 family)